MIVKHRGTLTLQSPIATTMEGPLDAVRRTTAEVAEVAERVKISRAAISSLVREGSSARTLFDRDLGKWDEMTIWTPARTPAWTTTRVPVPVRRRRDPLLLAGWRAGVRARRGRAEKSVRRTGGMCVYSSPRQGHRPELRRLS